MMVLNNEQHRPAARPAPLPTADTYMTVTRSVRDVQRLPDGSPIPSPLKHALLVLATYYPNIWPSQERLAGGMGIKRRGVNVRLRALEDAGLIVRHRRGVRSTAYELDLNLIRLCALWCPNAVSPSAHETKMKQKKDLRPVVSNRSEHKPEPVLPVDDFEDDLESALW
jgi:hypothetical protein